MKRRNISKIIIALVITAGLITGCDDTDTSYDEPAEAAEQDDTGDINPQESEEDLTDVEAPEPSKEDAAESQGEIAQFTVYDNELKEVSLGSLISGNKVTMLNFWGTFCGPCINEMPDLAAIERDHKDKGFEIVGVTIDAVDYTTGQIMPDIIKDAESIIEETTVEYPVIYAGVDLIGYMQIEAVPTTVFVDSSGNLLTEPLVGSRSKADWEAIISELCP